MQTKEEAQETPLSKKGAHSSMSTLIGIGSLLL
jgi:hypothetical protein